MPMLVVPSRIINYNTKESNKKMKGTRKSAKSFKDCWKPTIRLPSTSLLGFKRKQARPKENIKKYKQRLKSFEKRKKIWLFYTAVSWKNYRKRGTR